MGAAASKHGNVDEDTKGRRSKNARGERRRVVQWMRGTRRARCLLHLRRWNFDPLGGRQQAKLSETRRDETRRDEAFRCPSLRGSTLTRTEETLMNACVATTALSCTAAARLLRVDAGRGAPVAGDNYDESRLATVVNSLREGRWKVRNWNYFKSAVKLLYK